MPYYFGNAFDTYFNATYGVHSSGCSYQPNISQLEMFIDDLLDWADMKFGEEGDCEDDTEPKSNRNTYNTFCPKSSDITPYGIFLRNFMDINNIGDDLFTNTSYTIYNYINDMLSKNIIETLFHALTIDDQVLFIENIPTLQYDLRRHFDCESENIAESGSSEEEEETSIYEEANCIIRIIGNIKFEEMITLCEDINDENKTVYDLFSFIQREFSVPGQINLMWDDIIICCSSIYYGKLDEGYIAELMEIPEAPICSWEEDNEENNELSDIDDLSDDEIPELLSPSEIDDNFFEHTNIEPIPISSFQNESSSNILDEAYAHLENAHITVRRNRHRHRSIRV